MRTQSLIRHEQWSVVVELRFDRVVGLRGSKASVHHIDADGLRWGTDRDGTVTLALLRRGEMTASCTNTFLTGVRLLSVPPPGSRTHAHWRSDEDQRLRDEHELATPPAGIARLLGRSEGAVLSRMVILGLPPANPTRVPRPRAGS